MSLHSIVEPAGTLLTGWKLVPADPAKADIRNRDAVTPARPDEGERTPETVPETEASQRKLRKVR